MTIALPIDIFTHITSILSSTEDSRQSLVALSQTCRALVPLCQPYIFQSVQFITPPKWDILNGYTDSRMISLHRFHLLLERSPHLACCVREFRCAIEARDTYLTPMLLFFGKLLGKLQKLEALYLQSADMIEDWSDLEEGVTTPLVRLFGLPTLRKLRVDSEGFFNFPSCILSTGVSMGLVELLIKDLMLSPPDDTMAETTSVTSGAAEGSTKMKTGIRYLHTLSMGSRCTGDVDKFLVPQRNSSTSNFDLSQLKDLCVPWDTFIDVMTAQNLLSMAYSLDTLRCQLYKRRGGFGFDGLADIISPPYASPSHPPPSSRIKILQLIFPLLRYKADYYPTPLPDFFEELHETTLLQSSLGNKSGTNVLEHLIITIDPWDYVKYNPLSNLFPIDLSFVLAEESLPYLHKVTIETVIPANWDYSLDTKLWHSELEEQIFNDLKIENLIVDPERLEWEVRVRTGDPTIHG